MPRNIYISHGTSSEKDLYEDLIIESIRVYGVDVYYLPRSIIELDKILNEDVISKFDKSFVTEMYIESIDGFEGDGKLITKFGLEIRDQITLVVSRRRWNQLVGRWGDPTPWIRPIEGDLIFLPFVKGLYEIKYVDDKKPFLQLGGMPTYKLVCELFEYANQNFDTGIEAIDNIQGYSSAGFAVVTEFVSSDNIFEKNEKLRIELLDGTLGSTEYLRYHDTSNPLQKELFIGPLTWDDGEFRVITDGAILTSVISGTTGEIIRVETIFNSDDEETSVNDDNAQNNQFEIEGGQFIDFTENNPFSEGSIS